MLEYPLSAVLKRDLVGDLASEQGDLKASTSVPPASSVFPILKGMGELQHLITTSAPAKRAPPSTQIERQRAHEESIHSMVVQEQSVEEMNGDRQFPKPEEEEEEEEDDVEVDYVADCAEDLLGVSCNALTTSSTMEEERIQSMLLPCVLTHDRVPMSTSVVENKYVTVADAYPKLLRSALLCRKMDEYLRNTLIMRVSGTMTREERKEKDPSFFLLSARYQGKARFGLQGAEVAEGLCEQIFSRIENLRVEGVPKSAKQRAVGDLLRKMREEGVSHLKSLVPIEIRQSVLLLSVPPPLACETAADLFWSSSGSTTHTHTNNTHSTTSTNSDVFQKAETYFTRSIAELDQLRVQAVAPSAQDISSREATLMVATAENLFCSALRLRCALSAGLESRRSSLNALQKLQELTACTHVNSLGDGEGGGGDFTAKSGLILRQERLDYTVRAGSAVLDNLVQLRKLVRTSLTAHQPDHMEDSPYTATASMSVSVIQGTVQTVGRAIGAIDSLLTSVHTGADSTTNANVVPKSKEKDLRLYDALAVAEQEKKEAVWYASFGNFHLPPSSSSSSVCSSSVAVERASSALTALLGERDNLFALLSQDVAQPVIDRLQEYVDTLSSLIPSPTSSPVESNLSGDTTTTQVDCKAAHCLSAVVDESLIAVQRIRAIAERTGKFKMSSSDFTSAKINGCFGESITLTSLTEEKTEEKGRKGENESGKDSEKEKEKVVEMKLVDLLSLGMTSFSVLNMHKLTAHVTALCGHLGELSNSTAESSTSQHTRLLVQQIACPLVSKVLSAEAVLLRDLCESYKSCGKLLYVLLRVFRVLLAKGLCSDETKESEGGGGEGERQFEDDAEGTGMGEGEGKKDVSDQIENEEQLLGLRDDIPKEDKDEAKQESKELSEEEKDKGVEMSQDFEGDMFDIPEDRDPDSKDDDQEDVRTFLMCNLCVRESICGCDRVCM